MESVSLPEALLTLERADRRRTGDLIAQTRALYLASGAKWSKKIGSKLEEFMKELAEALDGYEPPKRASVAELTSLFVRLGIKPQS